jgi:hypothetical protein
VTPLGELALAWRVNEVPTLEEAGEVTLTVTWAAAVGADPRKRKNAKRAVFRKIKGRMES